MVVGSGIIGNAFINRFSDNNKVIIFASGVSNSKYNEVSNFTREQNLICSYLKNSGNKIFVYFSTCGIYDPYEINSPYIQHKLTIEKLVQERCKHFLICRVSNVVGNTSNQNTVFNYLFNHIYYDRHFRLWKNAIRNLIDIDHVKEFVTIKIDNYPPGQYLINIANPISYSVIEIVNEIENFLGKRGSYELVEFGGTYSIDLKDVNELNKSLSIPFQKNYVNQLLFKYYKRWISSK